MLFIDFLTALTARGKDAEAWRYMTSASCEAATRGVNPEDLLVAEFDDVVALIKEEKRPPQLPGWDLTVWCREVADNYR